MATSPEAVEHILDQMDDAGAVRARKMFGEYGLYCDDRMVGVVCGDQLFIKLTEAGTTLEPDLERAPPYERAKPALVVPSDLLNDPERLSALVRATADALPPPKPKRAKRPRRAKRKG